MRPERLYHQVLYLVGQGGDLCSGRLASEDIDAAGRAVGSP